MAKKSKKIIITIEQKGDLMAIHLKIPRELENFFSKMSEGKYKISNRWKQKHSRAKFYELTEKYTTLFSKMSDSYLYFDDYGDGLLRNDKINIGIIRTKGASKGITLYCVDNWGMNNMELERYIRALGAFLKDLWEQVITTHKVQAIISFEL